MEITLEEASPMGITPGSLDYSCQPVRRLARAIDKGEGGEYYPPSALMSDPSRGGVTGEGGGGAWKVIWRDAGGAEDSPRAIITESRWEFLLHPCS